MCWGGIASTDIFPLVLIDGNLDATKYVEWFPSVHEVILPKVDFFQQYNAPPHVSRRTLNCLMCEASALASQQP